jgi:hypothetical protein
MRYFLCKIKSLIVRYMEWIDYTIDKLEWLSPGWSDEYDESAISNHISSLMDGCERLKPGLFFYDENELRLFLRASHIKIPEGQKLEKLGGLKIYYTKIEYPLVFSDDVISFEKDD